MLKKIKKFLLFFVLFFVFFIPTLFAAFTISSVSPSQINQGDTSVTVKVYLTSGIKEPNTTYGAVYSPSFNIDGMSVADVKFDNAYLLEGTVTVPRNASVGNHTVTVYGADGTGTYSTSNPILSATSTMKVISKPMILGCSPVADYQKAGASVTFYGVYFDTSGPSNVSVAGSGYFGYATPTVSSITITGIDFTTKTPGGPSVVNITSNDSGVGKSEDGAGNSVQMFTLYPAPKYTGISLSSVYQNQQGVTLRIYGSRFPCK